MTALIRLVTLPDVAPGGAVPVLFDGLEALSRAHSLEVVGSEDLVTSAEEFAASGTSADRRVRRVVAIADEGGRRIEDLRGVVPADADPDVVPGPEAPGTPGAAAVVGAVSVAAPLGDNTHLVEIGLLLDRAWRHSGLGELLVDLAERTARQWGRTTVWCWTDCPGWAEVGSGGAVPGVRTPVPGEGREAAPVRTHETDLLDGAGYRPLHSEWMTTLDVAEVLAARPVPVEVPGYELVTWSSPHTPGHLLDELARIYALASTDMPSGDMAEEPEVWDAQRVLRKEALAERSRQEWVVTAVRPVGGELVGWTKLDLSPTVPEIAYQEGTLVRGDHRGHGLATWMKRVNLAELRARHPRVRRVHTWNDGANEPVIAMNRRLGFRPTLIDVGWEKELGVVQDQETGARGGQGAGSDD